MRAKAHHARHGQDLPTERHDVPKVAEVIVRYCGTVLEVRHVGPDDARDHTGRFSIGESPDASFAVPAEGLPDAAAFELVRVTPLGCELRFGGGLRGSIQAEGGNVTLAELAQAGRARREGSAWTYDLPPGTRCRVDHGDLTFFVRAVPPGEKIVGRGEVDRPFLMTTGASALALGSLFALLAFIPADELGGLDMEDLTDSRFVGYMMQPDEDEPEDPTEPTTDTGENSKPDDGAPAQRGATGKMGNPRDSRQAGRFAVAKINPIPSISRNQAFEDPRQTGILGVLQTHNTSVFASVDGGIFTSGMDDENVWGTLSRGDVAAGWGVGGLGPVGTGRGGGGMGEGTVGLSGVGTIGVTKRTGTGDRWGHGNGVRHEDRNARKPRVAIAKPESSPGLGKDVIRRVVRAHINEIRHCYNQGLVKDPGLEGRVVTKFTIAPTGNVQFAVIENGIGDKNVDRCISTSVKRWRFPRPDGGGTVIVSYPFVLSSSR